MEFKSGFWGRLFGFKRTERDGEHAQEQSQEQSLPDLEPIQGDQTVPLSEPQPEPDINQLILSHEHPFILLYEKWREQVGYAPLPHLRLDYGDEDGPVDENLEKELSRLRRAITAVAADRLSQIPKEPEPEPPSEEESEAKEDVEEEVEEEPPFQLDAQPLIYVTADQLAAWLVVFPPIGEGRELDKEMLDGILKESGVSYGLNTELLDGLPDAQDRYFHLFLIARGRAVVHGKDGYIEDFFKRTVRKKFEEDEHGRVDYFHLNIVQNVEKGQPICQIVPPVPGVAGRTVLDEEITCKEGKTPTLPKGRNTEASEDGMQLLAVKSGRVEFSGRSFVVKSVLEISGNVDFSTGNINFVGDVHIHGDVGSGFSVRTIGNVTIDGVVEAAEIEAGGDLIVAKGILGDSRAMIRAHHDVYAKYMENCTVHCRGSLQTDCIVNCDVYCDGEVNVRSGRGTIIGGRIRAAQGVDAKVVGSKSESVTSIFLGGQPFADFERETLLLNIKKQEAELEKLERQPDSPTRTQRMGKLRLDLSIGRMKLSQFDKELKKIKEKLEEQGGCRLKCSIAYPGVALTIGDLTMPLAKETSMVDARLVGGEICLL
ncbi:MAG: DUF342 domain-containing protein [Dorea sp.]|uniref:DUF342 domain-containing protein n=1 Tax=Sporofaciens musculi TaxID=2681861 RepID=UPI002171B6B1|nr:FapA family protein [Sporofaciens musculi]MCI9423164.1 DUF342 domain-containing protein [Dorea sp.]